MMENPHRSDWKQGNRLDEQDEMVAKVLHDLGLNSANPKIERYGSSGGFGKRGQNARDFGQSTYDHQQQTEICVQQRPKDMTRFDQIFICLLAMDILQSLLALPFIDKISSSHPVLASSGMNAYRLLSSQALGFLVMLVVWFCISRLRSKIARGYLVLSYLSILITNIVRLYYSPPIAIEMPTYLTWWAGIQAIVNFIAVYFLYTPASKAWFAAGRRGR